MVKSSKPNKNLPSVYSDIPSTNIFCEALKNSRKTELSAQIKQANAAYRLFHPLLEGIDGMVAKQMPDKIMKAREPVVSQCIIVHSKKN